ncbi:MAG: hypothetical protein Q4G52_10955 [Clostridia bacterium]|nr:hypothetical protein [Clostridia bacterium]
MERRIIVSGGDQIRELIMPEAVQRRCVRLEGALALAARDESLFCACGDVIWRLEASRLVPAGLFAGGPGVCQLALSPCGKRLYALLEDADSLLMLDALSGAPLVVNRVGVCPRAMAMDEEGEIVAVAGGECAQTVLLCAKTLDVLSQLPMPGMVYAVALSGGTVYSLSLNDTLNTTLTTVSPGGVCRSLALSGMPGALCLSGGLLLAATHGYLYTIAPDGSRVLCRRSAAGRARRLFACGGQLLVCDMLGEAVFALDEGQGNWRMIGESAVDAAIL